VTFVHEFQHMISFNQHVLLRGTNGEVLWLNEGMSHYARSWGEELRALAEREDHGLHDWHDGVSLLRRRSPRRVRLLDSTDSHFCCDGGIGSLAERGAAWLFVRYVVDRYAPGAPWRIGILSLGRWTDCADRRPKHCDGDRRSVQTS